MRRITTILLGVAFAVMSAGADTIMDTIGDPGVQSLDRANLSAPGGQIFTTGTLVHNDLQTIDIQAPRDTLNSDPFCLAVYVDTDQDTSTWDPGTLVGISTTVTGFTAVNAVSTWNFSGEILSNNTVYAYKLVTDTAATNDYSGMRVGFEKDGSATTEVVSGGSVFGGSWDVATKIKTTDPAIPPPTIDAFDISTLKVNSNDTVTLTWDTTGADTLTLEPGSIPVTGTSSDVVVTGDTTYWLVAENATATVSNSVSVSIYNTDITVLWRRDWDDLPHNTNIDASNLDGASSTAYGIGTQDFNPIEGTTRTFDNSNVGGRDLISLGGSDTFTNTIKITSAQYAADTQHTLEFVIGTGSSGNLTGSWFAEFGTTDTFGTFTPLGAVDAGTATWNLATTLNDDENFMDDTNFSDFFGYNTGGRIIKLVVDATDAVNGQDIAIRFGITNSFEFAGFSDMAVYSEAAGFVNITGFTVSDNTVESGDTVELAWSTVNASSVTLNNGIGSVPESGSTNVVITAPIIYDLVATGVGGPVTSQVSIAIAPLEIVQFYPSASTVNAGEMVTLSWDVLSEDTLTLNPGSIDVTGLLSYDVTVNSNTTYELIASAGGTSVTSTVPVVAVQPRPWEIDSNLIGTTNGTVVGDSGTDQAGPMYGQSITINVGATTDDAQIPQSVALKQVSFQVTSSGTGLGTDTVYLHVYDAFNVDSSGVPTTIGNLIAVSTSTVDFSAVSALDEVTWSFNNDQVDKATEYFYIMATNTTAATVAESGNLSGSGFELEATNPYSGGQGWRANGDTSTWDLNFEVVTGIGSSPIGEVAVGTTPSGDITLGWDTVSGQTYNVETNGNLLVVSGWGIYDTIIGDGGSISITSTPTETELFYKVTSP